MPEVNTLDEYQEKALGLCRVPKPMRREYLILGLVSEVGEVADLLKRLIRDGDDLEELPLELGDVLWYLSNLCAEYGYSLDHIAAENIRKLEARHK